MRGTFRFYQEGKLVAARQNLLTNEGKRLVLRYLSGQSASLGEAIGLGVSTTAAAATDSILGFEVARIPVILKNADYTNNVVVFKGTLPLTDVYTIYEAGLWSQYDNPLAGEFASRTLTEFDIVAESWTNMTADNANSRSYGQAGKVTVAASTTVSVRNSSVLMDLSGYSGNDKFLLAFYKPDNNIAGITLVFEDTSLGGNFKSAEINVAALPVGYNVVSVAKSAMVQTGNIAWSNINQYGFDVRAGTTGSSVSLDAYRIEDTDTINRDYVLVSHAVSSTPLITKTATAPMDVEYALDFVVT